MRYSDCGGLLKISFLGKPRIEFNQQDITKEFGSKAIALLCLLMINRNGYCNREKILAYLWPNSNDKSAKYNLRFNLWTIKKNVGLDGNGNEFLCVDRERCSINKDYEYQCDIALIKDLLDDNIDDLEDLETMRHFFNGELLEGYYFKECNEFNEVIIYERNLFEVAKVKLLLRLAKQYENRGDLDSCLNTLEETVKFAPYDEDIVLKIMEIYELQDKNSLAVIYYNTYKNRLVNLLGTQPSKKLTAKFYELSKRPSKGVKLGKTDFDTNNKQRICIKTKCINGIKYFWMASVIKSLLEVEGLQLEDYLTDTQLRDLSYIQPDIANSLGETSARTEVPDVRIAVAFVKLIEKISDSIRLKIIILAENEMDDFSRSLYEYLQDMRLHVDLISE
ncbi:AfsR/SARP family transcriptional regulator [Aminicella lysinilytica]|uniref:DNA-binding SARP family transcriptional activator n=1 Tax=Aminicella lysinilytica TaxID=433323 RepID=A0A4R6PX10_9FIRM|nr:BTAD domain-containing putative transcriptional regulator [Aminicella lysinilytica]TDP48635.1 DNA-binding SARP family transcriptional activator [Aminicella lysinilytica]